MDVRFFAVAGASRLLNKCVEDPSFHMDMVVRFRMKVPVCAGGFVISLRQSLLIPCDQHVQKRKFVVFFILHGESYGLSYRVLVVKDIVEVLSVVGQDHRTKVSFTYLNHN